MITRRGFLSSSAALAALAACSSRPSPMPAQRAVEPKPLGPPPQYLVLLTLRGGYDNIMSVAPKAQDDVGDKIFCGYRGDDRVRGANRLFGPLIDDLVRYDDDLCIIHGVRSDTTSHPDGLAMLTRGSRSSRSGEIATTLGTALAGSAPLPTLDLATADGEIALGERARPAWADLRADADRDQLAALGATEAETAALVKSLGSSAILERFLDETRRDREVLDAQYHGFLAHHFRLAFQAIRGNWAKCIQIASMNTYFDSHSDNVRYQAERQPSVFKDLATFIKMLKSTRNEHGSLFDQTTIAVFSELGRFPRLNAQAGKDHFPENSWLLFGKGIAKGKTIGEIDQRGKGIDVDFRTGLASRESGRPIYLENAFATLLEIAGGDPVKAGFAKDSVLTCAQV